MPTGPPVEEPIGRILDATARQASRAFDKQLAEAGGTRPARVILVALKQQRWRTQQGIATAVVIEGPTLAHHLDAVEKSGLTERSHDREDRRAMRVELSDSGAKLF